jgi:hypothetical protein
MAHQATADSLEPGFSAASAAAGAAIARPASATLAAAVAAAAAADIDSKSNGVLASGAISVCTSAGSSWLFDTWSIRMSNRRCAPHVEPPATAEALHMQRHDLISSHFIPDRIFYLDGNLTRMHSNRPHRAA